MIKNATLVIRRDSFQKHLKMIMFPNFLQVVGWYRNHCHKIKLLTTISENIYFFFTKKQRQLQNNTLKKETKYLFY